LISERALDGMPLASEAILQEVAIARLRLHAAAIESELRKAAASRSTRS